MYDTVGKVGHFRNEFIEAYFDLLYSSEFYDGIGEGVACNSYSQCFDFRIVLLCLVYGLCTYRV